MLYETVVEKKKPGNRGIYYRRIEAFGVKGAPKPGIKPGIYYRRIEAGLTCFRHVSHPPWVESTTEELKLEWLGGVQVRVE